MYWSSYDCSQSVIPTNQLELQECMVKVVFNQKCKMQMLSDVCMLPFTAFIWFCFDTLEFKLMGETKSFIDVTFGFKNMGTAFFFHFIDGLIEHIIDRQINNEKSCCLQPVRVQKVTYSKLYKLLQRKVDPKEINSSIIFSPTCWKLGEVS